MYNSFKSQFFWLIRAYVLGCYSLPFRLRFTLWQVNQKCCLDSILALRECLYQVFWPLRRHILLPLAIASSQRESVEKELVELSNFSISRLISVIFFSQQIDSCHCGQMAEKKPYFISHRQPNNIASFSFLRKQAFKFENKLSNNMNVFDSVLV